MIAMIEMRDLTRLYKQVECYVKHGYWPDGEKVDVAFIADGGPQVPLYFADARNKFEQSIRRIPKGQKEAQLEALLENLSKLWNGAITFLKARDDEITDYPYPSDIKFALHREVHHYIAIAYYYFLQTVTESDYNVYESCHGLTQGLLAGDLSEMNFCTAKKFRDMDYAIVNAQEDKSTAASEQATPSQKAQNTMKEEIDYNLNTILNPVCKELVKEKMVIRSSDKLSWIFKGTEEQYAYVGIKFKKACNLSKIPWQSLTENIHFDGKISTVKRYASEFSSGKREFPDGRIKINCAFDAALK
jgi:hypothetical protein